MMSIKRKQEIQVKIEKVAFGGKGIAHLDNFVIFIKDTLPGDVINARIVKKKKNYAEANLLEICSPSPYRISPPCPYFNWCGGCTWQNLEYRDQLKMKHEHVIESITHISGINSAVVLPPIPAGKIWGYRNKMEFSFSDHRWFLPDELGNPNLDRSFVLGLHVPGTYNKIINIDRCMLQSETANRILRLVFDYSKRNNLSAYNLKTHEGFLRFLVIRESFCSGELMVNIVTAYENKESLISLAEYVMDRIPEITSFINTVNERKAQIASGDTQKVIAGNEFITDKLFDLSFKISANSFFQTNTAQAEKLYRTVLQFCEPKTNEIIWDLYCGTGTISIFLARHVKLVIGFELIESSLQDAVQNVTTHSIDNIRFIAGDLVQMIQQRPEAPDTMVLDPPRSGVHPSVTQTLNRLKTRKIIYVSCNPATMARDIQLLAENYNLIKVQPVDMFPHTYHIESVALLERKNK